MLFRSPKGKFLLRCLWKDALPLHSKAGNQLSSPDEMGCPGFSSMIMFFSGYMPRSGIAGSYGSFLKKFHTAYHQ